MKTILFKARPTEYALMHVLGNVSKTMPNPDEWLWNLMAETKQMGIDKAFRSNADIIALIEKSPEVFGDFVTVAECPDDVKVKVEFSPDEEREILVEQFPARTWR